MGLTNYQACATSDSLCQNGSQMSHLYQIWMSERLIHKITAHKLMDLGFSIVTDILFITKHKIDHILGPNSNIDKVLSVLDSHQEAKKEQKTLLRNSSMLGDFCC